ncbi:hypothetical protein H632_c249p0 [Helicosporidium sp. ATCC 50920]|nr:hypothetical protein H632_c249p0 [Helicosporidium sp. ATCC 50920]|eukprot:KDD76376.1 hypothetical protein H632_c249p0 [Helicosporidium sp. ATCC 50920]
MSLRDAFDYLLKSPPVRCLAILALCQGMCSVLLDLAWKHHVHLLAPSPPEYAAFMGQTAMWTGIVTCGAMLVSPLMFELLGWLGVARATPSLMLWGGSPFFIGAAAFQLWLICRGAGAGGPAWVSGFFASVRPLLALLPGPVERFAAATFASPLRLLVLAGAALQVASKGAKFSLYKPAEEMVYIGLDAESRSKGKAAIDVVGAQSGKAIGSLFQQGLLLVLGGRMGAVFPILGGVFVTLARMWLRTVDQLGAIRRDLGADGQAHGSHAAAVQGEGLKTSGPAGSGDAVETSDGVPAETEKTLTRP